MATLILRMYVVRITGYITRCKFLQISQINPRVMKINVRLLLAVLINGIAIPCLEIDTRRFLYSINSICVLLYLYELTYNFMYIMPIARISNI